ncbi:hypothetical protein GGS26DRAFT_556061 [Hypomontagnella submonticulosa]|nr:hypothetical protein GGS26DRAFT_556061 [Hypomontagnella submonticulosa]
MEDIAPELRQQSFKLDYEVHDSLPELPMLDQSARARCDFCDFLRKTVQSRGNNNTTLSSINRISIAELGQCTVHH